MTYPLSATECRLVIEHSPVMVWRSGVDAHCDYFNDMWLSFTGRTLVQEMGDGWAEGVHPDDVERCIAHYFDHFRRRMPFDLEYRLRRHDGVYRWIFDRGVPFADDAGAFGGFIGSCIDVDDRRKAQTVQEQQANEEATRRRYSTFFSNAAGGSWTWMQLYRVALLSGLSGALAEEVIQPLTSILANAQAGKRSI